MKVAPRVDVLVGMNPRPTMKFDLVHPHEPSGAPMPNQAKERPPVGLLVLHQFAVNNLCAVHVRIVGQAWSQNKT